MRMSATASVVFMGLLSRDLSVGVHFLTRYCKVDYTRVKHADLTRLLVNTVMLPQVGKMLPYMSAGLRSELNARGSPRMSGAPNGWSLKCQMLGAPQVVSISRQPSEFWTRFSFNGQRVCEVCRNAKGCNLQGSISGIDNLQARGQRLQYGKRAFSYLYYLQYETCSTAPLSNLGIGLAR